MDKVLMVRGEPGQGTRMLFAAVVEWMRVGIGANSADGEFYPDIELYYPPDILPTIQKIVQEMDGHSLFPEIYLEHNRRKSYMMVLFRLKPVSHALLTELVPPDALGQIGEEIRAGKVELLMTGESEFPSKQVRPFLDLFQTTKYLNLFLLGPDKRPVWGVKLTDLKLGLPQL